MLPCNVDVKPDGSLTPVLRTVEATRYVTPLREGGSLPGLVEADDLGTYVVKFRGAGQGLKALVAEVVAGELGRRLGLAIPELVVVNLDPQIGRHEPDPEVQDVLHASAGTNLGMDFLPRALGYEGVSWKPDPATAARVLWFDGLVTNVDRSWRNPNLLVWHRELYCIDHGATLLFQHTWPTPEQSANRPYDYVNHALTAFTDGLEAADAELAPRVTDELLHDVVALVPDEWIDPATTKQAYVDHLAARAKAPRSWVKTP